MNLNDIRDYNCTLWQSFPRQGILYITEHFICFFSLPVLNAQSNIQFSIKITDITSISKEGMLGVLDNSMKVTTSAQQVSFTQQ